VHPYPDRGKTQPSTGLQQTGFKKPFFDDEEIQNDRFSTGNKSVEAPLHV
jgi:hypothetical protein